jgi:hypothetical protein
MAITTAICTSYKQEILEGVHTSTDTYKIALFTDSATLGASTTAYSSTNEVANGGGYTTGGNTLTGFASGVNKAVAAFDFGSNISSTNGTFTIDLPAAGASALIRIA